MLGNATFMDAARAFRPDIIVGEAFDRCPNVLAHTLGAPLVYVNAGPPMAALFGRLGMQGDLASNPALATGWIPPLNYWHRLKNAGWHAMGWVLQRVEAEPAWNALFARHGVPRGGAKEALAIFNSDFALEWHMNLPPHVLVPGPLLPEPGSPLPADLASFVAPGAARGGPVVFASLGSSFTRGPDWAAQLVDELQAALPDARLLLKFTAAELGDAAVAALPPRVKVVRWAPQNDLLGSGRVDLFITHGGANSVLESAYHGVPVVVMPAGAEQPGGAGGREARGGAWWFCEARDRQNAG